jgi:hypothetical protein
MPVSMSVRAMEDVVVVAKLFVFWDIAMERVDDLE